MVLCRIKSNGVLCRAIIVTVVLMSLSFAGTAYYHYRAYAATDYLCIDYPLDHGYPQCQPIDSYDMYLKDEHNYKYIRIPLIKRMFINWPSVHISKLYLENKYPNTQNVISDNKIKRDIEYKQRGLEYAYIRDQISTYYESRYIEEALAFAAKWTLLLPLSLICLLCIVLGTKNYILYGRIKAVQ